MRRFTIAACLLAVVTLIFMVRGILAPPRPHQGPSARPPATSSATPESSKPPRPSLSSPAATTPSTAAAVEPTQPKPARPDVPPTPQTRLDELVSRFRSAKGAMAAPEQATEGREEQVSLVLLPAGSTSEAMTLAAEAAPRSTPQPLEARFHELMEAKLTGDGFRIVPRTPERQAVPTVEPTRWAWTVVPVKTGQQSLHLALSAVVEAGGDHAPRLVTTFERTVLVGVQNVPVFERVQVFAERHWQWLLGAAGTVLGAGWRGAVWLRSRRKRQAPPSASAKMFE